MGVVIPLLKDVPSIPVLAGTMAIAAAGILFLRQRSAAAAADADSDADETTADGKKRTGKRCPSSERKGAQSSSSDSTPASPSSAPGTRVFTPEELAQYDNSDATKPVYLAIKGVVYDLTSNRETYPKGVGYGIFAGKDASRALANSSLDEDMCVPEWEDLPEDKIKVLDDWVKFFTNKYPIVGTVTRK
ncbi:hypothetical protein GGF32_001480 [Allomyces javanicus]|nr:hypothetical protein GGF32_001480 [Allomyces javanicus]